MCGLTGFLSVSGGTGDSWRGRIAAMTRRLAHRGPDAEDWWFDDRIALGHRRLAILDLSAAGSQPMHSACGRYVIAFNGEIYNHLDLRNDMKHDGVLGAWRGYSDTETLLAAISRFGIDEALKRANGMFALALWDRKTRVLSLARDRMGEKPLYWGWAGEALVFGSELKAIAAHPGFAGGVCREALLQYLRFSYVPAPRSIHPGIYKVEPGCIVEIEGDFPAAPPDTPLRPGQRHGKVSIRRFWSLAEAFEQGSRKPISSEAEAIQKLEETLRRAVLRQMISDVPIGAFLSGGVDSSTVVALMQRESTRPVKTFTIGFDDPAFDESPYAAAVAAHLGTDHTALIVTEADARAVIPSLPQLYDEPFGDSSQIPSHLVCKAARTQVSVALSGDAGDELFGGYNRYLLGPEIWRQASCVPAGIRAVIGRAMRAIPHGVWNEIGNRYNRFRPGSAGVTALGDKAHRLAQHLGNARSIDGLYRSLTSIWAEPLALMAGRGREPSAALDDPMPAEGLEDPALRMMFQDLRSYLPDDILCKMDRAAMAVGLETRIPLLDADVIRLATRLPVGMKIRGRTGKWVLRQVLYRHVPRELIERPKAGFAIPVGQWLRGPLRDWGEDLLAAGKLGGDGILNPDEIRRTWADHLAGRRDHAAQLWNVLMYQAWRHQRA